ncbi:hypothetical protein JCM11251_007852 [Rhodosporidiobolus azoricus]
MAFGSATVRASKTVTKTSTKSNASTHSNSTPVASTSKTRGRTVGRPDSSSEPESDFEIEARTVAKKETRQLKEQEADKRRKAEIKAYRERGETPPPELFKKQKAAKGKATFSDAVKAKEKGKSDAAMVIANAKRELAAKRGVNLKGKGKMRAFEDSEDEEGERPTRPTLNLTAKKREVEKRNGYRTSAAFADGAEGVIANRGGDLSDDEAVIRKHLSRRWVTKTDPTRMTAERKALELKYNPLISLLNIKLTVVAGSEFSGSDSDRRNRADHTHFHNETDSDGSSSPDTPAHRASSDGDDTDWDTDGMGHLNGTVKFPDRRRVQPLLHNAEEEEEDVKPKISTTPQGSPDKPFVPLPAPAAAASPVDVKPVILIDDDDEEEPATEEDEPSNASAIDVKPSPATLAKAFARPSFGRASEVRIKKEEPDQDVDMNDADGEDTAEEPDTEDEAIFVEPTGPHSTNPSTRCQSFASSQPLASSQLFSSVKAESQSQLSQRYSQEGSQLKTVKPESMDEDVQDEDEEGDAVIVYDVASVSSRQREEQELARRLQRHKEIQEQMAQDRKKREQEARDRGKEAYADEGAEDAEDEEDVEEELVAWKVCRRDPEPSLYPQPVKKGRPKFALQDAKQAKIGPHILHPDPDDLAQIPAPINKFLRPYQREGAEFLYGQYKKGMGGILGDDMGLGKTIQVIAFLSAIMGKQGLKKHDGDKRKAAVNNLKLGEIVAPSDLGQTCLIVCPASVVHNWEREFQTWGYFEVAIYGGTKKEKKYVLDRFDKGYYDVVLGSIEGVRNDIEELSRRDFSLVIVDEAHRVKNPKSRTTTALHEFPTALRYGLTGTAVQNKLKEFWCILNWTVPGKVGTQSQWEDLVSRPIKYAQKVDATDDELVTGRSRAQALVTSLLPNFFLRRTKDSVKLQLPKKTDNVVLCPLTSLQKDVYRRLLALEDVKIMLTADDPCPCGAKDDDGLRLIRKNCCDQEWTKLIFKYICLFQKVSNHLGLIYPDKEDKEKNPQKYNQDLEWARAAFPTDWAKRKRNATSFLDQQLCGKWKILSELLELWHKNGDKVLIFSMSLKVMDLLKDLMETTHYRYLSLDGSVPQDDRMPLVDEFNDPASDVFCFLISTRAGGVGLNLTAANRVVIFDPNWNPAHDLQAMDRAYRFGQRREVNVYRLIGAGTLEELIYNRQQYKRALASTAYDANAERRFYSGVEGEGKDEQGELWGVKNIFKFSENVSLTDKSIKRADLAELEYALQNTDLFETSDGKVEDLPDEDEEEVVAEVTGIRKKQDVTENMTPEELAKHEEQEKIARILGGTLRVQSDATLGGSSIETARGRHVVQAHVTGKKPATRPAAVVKRETSSNPNQPSSDQGEADVKPSKLKRPLKYDYGDGEYDPLARGLRGKKAKKARESDSSAADKKPIKREVSPVKREILAVKREDHTSAPSISPATATASAFAAGSILASHGIDPTKVSATEVIQAAGYEGSQGLHAFLDELNRAGSGRRRREMLEGVVKKWEEKEGSAGRGRVKKEK